MILHLILLLVAALPNIRGECILSPLPKTDKCRAALNCTVTLTDQSFNLLFWRCIRHERNNADYNYRDDYETEYTLDSNYELYVMLQKADINTSEDPLNGLNSVMKNNVKTLNVIEGNLVSVSPEIYELINLEELVVVKNTIEKLSLAKLSSLSSLTTLNMSRNSISTIETINLQKKAISGIHTIDLSYNELESIPDNCFLKFPRLLYLDLSHNLIKKIELLTFECMNSIETLLLSYNEIKDLGSNFVRLINLKILKLDHNEITSLSEENLKNLINLVYLNISSNRLNTIGEKSFSALQKLQEIDLSNNQIKMVHAFLFKNNFNLVNVNLSNNLIEYIEDGIFEGKNITELYITGNNIGGSINYKTFVGIHVDILDLSGGNITTVTDKAFSGLRSELTCLNLSRNSIEYMSKSCFNKLTELVKLDLWFK